MSSSKIAKVLSFSFSLKYLRKKNWDGVQFVNNDLKYLSGVFSNKNGTKLKQLPYFQKIIPRCKIFLYKCFL